MQSHEPESSPGNVKNASTEEKTKVDNLVEKIGRSIGKLIVENVEDPSTEYTEKTAILVAARLGHQIPGCHRALTRLNVPPKDSLVHTALSNPHFLN